MPDKPKTDKEDEYPRYIIRPAGNEPDVELMVEIFELHRKAKVNNLLFSVDSNKQLRAFY